MRASMVYEETRQNKAFAAKPRNHADSKTGVRPSRRHGVGIWGNPRVTMTIRVDEGLKKAFKPFAQRVFNSVCLPIECFMAGLLSAFVKAEEHGVHPGSTVKIDVDTIKIERFMRSRRRLEFLDGDVEGDLCYYCLKDHMGKKAAVGKFRYLKSGEVFGLCGFHARCMVDTGNWELVEVE